MIRYLWSFILKWGWDFNRDLREDQYSLSTAVSRMRSSRGSKVSTVSSLIGGDETVEMDTPIRFKVQKANGGTIVEVQHYDRKRDEHNYNLHIIPDGEDVSNHIGKIVIIEMMKS